MSAERDRAIALCRDGESLYSSAINEIEEAESFLRTGLEALGESDDRVPGFLRSHGLISETLHRIEVAENSYRQALELSRHHDDFNELLVSILYLGEFLVKRGRYQESLDLIQSESSGDPENAPLLRSLAFRAHLGLKQLEEARACLEKAKSELPDGRGEGMIAGMQKEIDEYDKSFTP